MEKKLMMAAWTIEMVLAIFVSCIYYLNLGLSTPNVLYVPQGSVKKIITYLDRKNFDITPLDGHFLRFIGMPQHGWIHLGGQTMTHADFLYKLATEKAAMRTVTLIPGETTYFFLNHIAETMNLDRVKLEYHFSKMSNLPEGTFVPDSYKLPIGINERDAIRLLLNRSAVTMQEWSQKIFGNYQEKKW